MKETLCIPREAYPAMPKPRLHTATIVLALATFAAFALAFAVQAQISQPPTVAIEHPDDEATVKGEVNVTGTASSLDGDIERVEVSIDEGEWREANGTESWNLTWDTTLWASGAHNVTARSWDGEEYSENDTINVHVNQPPKVTILAPEDNATTGGTVNVTGTAEDPEASLEGVQVRVDGGPWQNATLKDDWWFHWDTQEIPSGEHNVTARADDGNWTATSTVNVTVDQPPRLNIDDPDEGATLEGTVIIRGTAEDPEDGLERVDVRIGTGAWQETDGTTDWSMSWETTSVPDGDHQVIARADDGNSTTTSTVNVTVQNQDTEPEDAPTVTITQPEDGAIVTGNLTIEGTADASQGSIEQVDVRADDGPWRETNGSTDWSHTWDTTTLEEGSHTITARATDGVSTGTSSVNVTVDNDASVEEDRPRVTITGPEEGAKVAGTVTLEGTAETSQGSIETVEVGVGQGAWQEAIGTSNWTFQWDTTTMVDGPQDVTVTATDTQGTAGTATITVLIANQDETLDPAEQDRRDLQLSVDEPASGTTVRNELNIAGVVEASNASSATVEYRIDQGPWNEIHVSIGEPFEYAVDIQDLEEGDHQLTLRAVNEDEVSQEETVAFTVDDSLLAMPGPGLLVTLTAALIGHRWARQRA